MTRDYIARAEAKFRAIEDERKPPLAIAAG
jgi:hypothetical protein